MVARTWSGSTTIISHRSHGTYTVSSTWGGYVDAKVACSDGVVRKVKRIASYADTFFSVPCAVEVTRDGRRYAITGYFTADHVSRKNPTHLDMYGIPTLIFCPYLYRKNGHILPEWERRDINPKGVN